MKKIVCILLFLALSFVSVTPCYADMSVGYEGRYNNCGVNECSTKVIHTVVFNGYLAVRTRDFNRELVA